MSSSTKTRMTYKGGLGGREEEKEEGGGGKCVCVCVWEGGEEEDRKKKSNKCKDIKMIIEKKIEDTGT